MWDHPGEADRQGGGELNSYSSEERELFETQAVALYEQIAAEGGIADDDARIQPEAPERAAFELLRDLGLVHRPQDTDKWLPEDPATVQARIVAPLSVEGTRLLEESSQWARGFATLTHAWRRCPEAEGRGPFTYLRGWDIPAYLEAIVGEAESEVLTAQPQTGRELGKGLAAVTEGERALLSRGVRILTLYQHSARRSIATREYVAAITDLGGQVRTLDEFFNRIVVVDRRVAVIPAPDDLGVALAVREPTVVAYLVDVFMRSWERARPFTSSEEAVSRHVAQEQRAMTLRMLIEGHSDPVSAKRLGVSPRTYAGYIADLKSEFEVQTRFQLGYTIGRRGISGDEPEEAVRPGEAKHPGSG